MVQKLHGNNFVYYLDYKIVFHIYIIYIYIYYTINIKYTYLQYSLFYNNK